MAQAVDWVSFLGQYASNGDEALVDGLKWRLLHQTAVLKKSEHLGQWNSRTLSLFGGPQGYKLEWSNSSGTVTGSVLLDDHVALPANVFGRKNCFVVSNSRELQLHFQGKSAKETTIWIEILQAACSGMNYRKIKKEFNRVISQSKRGVPPSGSPVAPTRKTYQMDTLHTSSSSNPPAEVNVEMTAVPQTVVKEGLVDKKSRHIKQWNKRRLRLFKRTEQHFLEWTQPEEDAKSMRQIGLNKECQATVGGDSQSFSFSVSTPRDGVLHFRAGSEKDAAEWAEKITIACGTRLTL